MLFHAACRECDRPDGPTEIGFGGARGPGKSFSSIAQIALDDCQRVAGLKFLFLRRVGKAARESFEDLRIKVLSRVQHDYRRQEGVITFTNGSRILFGHFNTEKDIDNYLGIEYDGAVIEEATQLSESKYKQIKTCIRTSKSDWRPRIYLTTNPGGLGHGWFKKRFIEPFRKRTETETRFIPATFRDNRLLNPEYVKSLDDLVGWLKQAWKEGDWDIAAGQFFTNWRYDIHTIKQSRSLAGLGRDGLRL
jgi:PBSX family phage terminase large subunit